MRGTIKARLVAGVTLAAALGTAAPAGAAIVTSQASLVNGQLTIVGSGAVPKLEQPGSLVAHLPADRDSGLTAAVSWPAPEVLSPAGVGLGVDIGPGGPGP